MTAQYEIFTKAQEAALAEITKYALDTFVIAKVSSYSDHKYLYITVRLPYGGCDKYRIGPRGGRMKWHTKD